jgi:hypothetical protein
MSVAEEHARPGRTRSGSGVRQRQAQVGVRLTGEEYAALKAAADHLGQSPATVLRLAFIRKIQDCGCSHGYPPATSATPSGLIHT